MESVITPKKALKMAPVPQPYEDWFIETMNDLIIGFNNDIRSYTNLKPNNKKSYWFPHYFKSYSKNTQTLLIWNFIALLRRAGWTVSYKLFQFGDLQVSFEKL